MLKQLALLRSKLGDAEFLAVVLEPLLSWGIALSLVFFVCVWVLKDGKAQKVALLGIILCALSSIPFAHYYALAADSARGINAPTDELMAAHVQRLDSAQTGYLALAALAALTFFLGRGGKAGLWLTILTLAAATAGATAGLWFTLKSAEIIRPELREAPQAPAPAPASATPPPPLADGPAEAQGQ